MLFENFVEIKNLNGKSSLYFYLAGKEWATFFFRNNFKLNNKNKNIFNPIPVGFFCLGEGGGPRMWRNVYIIYLFLNCSKAEYPWSKNQLVVRPSRVKFNSEFNSLNKRNLQNKSLILRESCTYWFAVRNFFLKRPAFEFSDFQR